MSKSKLFFNQISKLIEQGLYNYKDLSDEFISILKSKRDELIYKLKLTTSEETEILIKRIENLEKKLDKIEKDIFKDKNKQSRIITADLKHKSKTIKLINIYTPNGNPVDTEKYTYKLYWLESLIKKLKAYLKKKENIIIGGDFNIIPSAEDVHNPKGYENDALFRLEIRKKLRELLSLGFHDAYRYIHPDKEGYTFWDYTSGAWQKNNGMRIDHFLVSNSIINLVKDVKINKFPRGRQKPSDHTPIEIELT